MNNRDSNTNNNQLSKKKMPIKRTFFSLLIIIGVIIGVVFSTKSIFENSKFGNLYGDGIRLTVDVNSISKNGNPDNKEISANQLAKSEKSIYSRISSLGLGKPTILTNKWRDPNTNMEKYSFSITQPNVTTHDGATKYLTNLVSKSRLSFYSIDPKSNADIPLFNGSNYNKDHTPEDSKHTNIQSIIKPDSAEYSQSRRGSSLINTISFDYNNTHAKDAYGDALSALATGDVKTGANKMFAWIDRSGLISLGENLASLKSDWKDSGGNLFKFIHVYKNHKMTDQLKTTQNSSFNASSYLISSSVVKQGPVPDKPTINSQFEPSVAKALAERINYGTALYTLTNVGKISFVSAPFGKTALNRLVISSIIIISLIIVFLIARYGIFGLVTSIAFILFISSTLLLFTIFQGVFTLLTIGAIIFGVILMLDASVVTFEELKQQLYEGKSIRRSINAANRHSDPSFFDSSFIILAISFIVFYAGSTYLPGFSVSIVISIMLVILISYVFIKFFTKVIISTGLLNKRSYLLGNYNSKKEKYLKNNDKLIKINYSKKSSLVLIGTSVTMVSAVIVFIITSIMSGSIWGGVNSDLNLTGGQQINVSLVLGKYNKDKPPTIKHPNIQSPKILDTKDLNQIYNIENKYDNNIAEHSFLYSDNHKSDNKINGVVMLFKNGYDTSYIVKELNNIKSANDPSENVIYAKSRVFANTFAKKIFTKAIIAMAIIFLFIVIYVLLRFRWTFSLATLIALLHDGLIVTAVFIILRLPFSSLFIGALFLVLFYSIFKKILVFNNMRKYIKNENITSKSQFKMIVNKALGSTLYRNIIMFIVFISIGIALVSVSHSSSLTFSLSIIIGSIASMISTYFVFPYFWIKIENLRFNAIKKHMKNDIWHVNCDEEQTFHNINEISEI